MSFGSGSSTSRRKLLLVDDDPISLAMLAETVESAGYHADCVESAIEALKHLAATPQDFSAVLLDRMMPEMDGIECLQKLKSDPVINLIPVIMQTAASEQEEIREGLEAGAYYYLTKPYDPAVLVPVIRAAVGGHEERQRLNGELTKMTGALRMLEQGVFKARTLADARTLAIALAGAFPDPVRVVAGLTELLVNAIEHGNAGISYADKTQLLASGTWEEEVGLRLSQPGREDACAEVRLERIDGMVVATIRDQGPGFDWKSYLDFSPERAFDSHGRGIALARMLAFDRLEYRGSGNEVVVSVHANVPQLALA